MLLRVAASLAMSLPVAAPIAGYLTWKLSSKRPGRPASKRGVPASPGASSSSSSRLRSRGSQAGAPVATIATTGTDAVSPTTASRGSQVKAAAVDAGVATRRVVASATGSQTSRAVEASSTRAPILGHVPGFAARVAECNEITEADLEAYVPLIVAGKAVGLMQPSFADELVRHGDGVFARVGTREKDGEEKDGDVDGDGDGESPARGGASPSSSSSSSSWPSSSSSSSAVVMDPDAAQTVEQRTAAAANVMAALRDAGVITGWRDELFPVNESYGEPPVMLVERAAASLLGIRAYGVHVNGYTTAPDGTLRLWVARRSMTKPTWPGKLDHLVAGGLPHGVAPGECVVKECGEEASVPVELAQTATPVGVITYNANYLGCCKRDVLFCYDLELPADFDPVAADGEVESFELFDIPRLMDTVSSTDEFKTNCAVVIIDFLVRHGYLSPEEPGYAALVKSLRQ